MGMVTQGGQGLGGLLVSEVQCHPPVSQVAQRRRYLSTTSVDRSWGGGRNLSPSLWQSKSEVGMGFLRLLTTLKK